MTHIATLIERLATHGDQPAVIEDDRRCSHAELLAQSDAWLAAFESRGIDAGSAVAIRCGYDSRAIACFIAVLRAGAVAVLVAPNDPAADAKCEQAGVCAVLEMDAGLGTVQLVDRTRPAQRHTLIDTLIERGHPGFVVFSSGSSGEPKAVLHDAHSFCTHLVAVQKALSTVAFLTLDHIAGVDTLLYTLFAGGALIVPRDRSPLSVCQAIEAHGAQVLPASPSFLKLLLLSDAWVRCDLSSLKIITFGSEPVDPRTSEQLARALPGVNLLQKYGTSEFGAPRSRTRPGDTTWIRLDSAHFQTRVVDGLLWVKASGTMLGYLNHPTPATDDGWYCTGDRVEQDGEWLRILGRESDMINVGGDKVFPAEVERCIEQMPQVLECAVSSEPNDLLGNVVVATIHLKPGVQLKGARKRVRDHCAALLPRHAIPMKVTVTDQPLTNERGKRIRR